MTSRYPNFAPDTPILRGTFHAQMAAVLPTIWASLVIARPDRMYAVTVIAVVCEFQLVASARLHLMWHLLSPDRLRWTQVVDHGAIAVSVATIGWAFGGHMTWTAAMCAAHIAVKCVGSAHFTRTNGCLVAATFAAVVITTVPVLHTWEQQMRFAVCCANVAVAKGAYLAAWPLRGHAVWDYHILSHMTTTAVMAMLFWEVLA